MKKKIAVVIVTFNGENWIKKNLSSLLNSNYPIDIIIVDNASTDETINIIKELNFFANKLIISESENQLKKTYTNIHQKYFVNLVLETFRQASEREGKKFNKSQI